MAKNFLRLIRARHYMKNILVLLPLIFGRQLTNAPVRAAALWGFASFCLLASAVYIFNDLLDVRSDRMHPTKRYRMIASGAVSPRAAGILAAVLLARSAGLCWLACGAGLAGWAAWAAYALLNVGYSLGLKRVPVLDIAVLVSGFLLRVLYGSAVTGIEISKWMYLTVIAVSFYLALGKRRGELIQQGDAMRAVLAHYTPAFLTQNMYMCLTLSVAFYALWSVDPVTVAATRTGALVWTVPVIILLLMRYSMIVEGSSDGDPIEVILSDPLLLVLAGLLGLALLVIMNLV